MIVIHKLVEVGELEHMRRSPDELIGRGAHLESRKLDLAQQGSTAEISLVTNKKGLNIS